MIYASCIEFMPRLTFAYILLACSIGIYGGFWIWALVHAARTPRASLSQRILWVGSLVVNPSTAIWYWYVWKRWAFWLLFTPVLGLFVSFPYIVRSLLTKADATRMTDILFALGSSGILVFIATLMVFPLILRLIALLHLGRNTDTDAMERNDWVMAISLPVFGFGAGFAYCAKYKRPWAFACLAWWIAITLSSQYIWKNVSPVLQPAGEERRAEFKSKIQNLNP